MSPADFDPKGKGLNVSAGQLMICQSSFSLSKQISDCSQQLERGQCILCASSLSPLKFSDYTRHYKLPRCDVCQKILLSKSQGKADGGGILLSKSQGKADGGGLNFEGKAGITDREFDDSEGEGHTTDTTDFISSDGSSGDNKVLTTDAGTEGPRLDATTAVNSGSYPNWKDVTPDILSVILKFLPLADNIRFGAVCANWYSAASQSCHPPAPQPPFLLLPGDSTGTSDYCQFFDLSCKKFYKIHLPQLRNRRCLGSSQGKLIYIDERAELHVLDPITGSEFDLPSITTFDNVGDPKFDEDRNELVSMYRAIYGRRSFMNHGIEHLIDFFYDKVIICPKTSAAIAICQEEMVIAFCMPGDRSWTMIDAKTPTMMLDWPLQEFWDIVFYKGVLYTLTRDGKLGSLQVGDDFKTIKVEVVGPNFPPEHEHEKFTYLVEAGGELLQVWRRTNYAHGSGYGKVHVTSGFRVFKMNWGSMLWEEMKDLGDYALFLGLNDSFSLLTRNFPELKPNCIYFTDDDFDKHVGPRVKRDAGVFNLRDGTIKPCYPSDDNVTLNWPHLIWFTPKGFPSRYLNVTLR